MHMHASCSLCLKKINFYQSIDCSLCFSTFHLTCVNLDTDSIKDWYCVKCLESIFPFNGIVNDEEFKSTVFWYGCLSIDTAILDSLNKMVYNPFTCERKRAITNNLDIDPDISYFNSETQNSCTYFLPDEFNSIVNTHWENINKMGRFSLMHINCRSLLCNFNEIVDFTCSLNNIFDVVCMSETWLSGSTDDQVDIAGFTFVGKNRENKRGGGVGMYVKNDLKYKIRTDIYSNNENTCELIAIEIVNDYSKNIVVITVYRPPGTDIEAFSDTINGICALIKNENKLVFWAGDFNINILNADSHTATGNFLNTMASNAFYPAITKPTRINEFSATIIDNIFTNASTNSFKGIIYKNISDHLPIFVINETNVKKRRVCRKIESRDMGVDNILKLQGKLESLDWSSFANFDDVNTAYQHFITIFKQIYDECCPIKIRNVKNNFRKPWMTPALLKSTKTKDKLYKRYQKCPTTETKRDYCAYKNIFTTLKRKAEKNYLATKFEQANGNLKETWKIIKDVINKKQTDSLITDSFKFENKIITSPEDISNKFNDFFVTIGPNLDAKIDPSRVNFKTFLSKNIKDSFYIEPVSSDEIIRTIDQCKSKYSSGWDNIPMAIIKSVGSHIASPFAHICNLSFSTGIFPSEMKTREQK